MHHHINPIKSMFEKLLIGVELEGAKNGESLALD